MKKLLFLLIIGLMTFRVQGASEVTIIQRGDFILDLLASADFKKLSKYTCSKGGLKFSPYTRNLDSLFVKNLSNRELLVFKSTKQKYLWGEYDGSGAKIFLTPMQYYAQFIYDVDYKSKSVRNHINAEQLNNDTSLFGLTKNYPNAEIVIYKYEGNKDLDYKNAKELILIFSKIKHSWCLEGLSHSEDTI